MCSSGGSSSRKRAPHTGKGEGGCGLTAGGSHTPAVLSASRPAAMAQLKAAGESSGSSHDCAELFSEVATVTSSAGESGSERARLSIQEQHKILCNH